jgi:hypothetical protein
MIVDHMRDPTRTLPVPPDPTAVTAMRIWHCKYRSLVGLVSFTGLRTLIVASYPDASLEPLRQHAVELHCAALPGSSQPVAQREFQLRSVERAFAGIDLRREAALPRGIAELRL